MRARLQISLAGFLFALALSSGVRADEVQVTITGTACTLMSGGCGTAVPYSVSFDINTASGQLGPGFYDSCPGSCLLTANTYAASGGSPFLVTNYDAIVGGQSIGSTGGNSFGLQLTAMGGPGNIQGYEWDMATSGLFLDTGVLPTITQAQYMAFKDPMESLLLEFFPAPGAPACCLNATLDGIYGLETANIEASLVSPTGVPEPGMWSLCLLGLAGLGLTRIRRTGRQR